MRVAQSWVTEIVARGATDWQVDAAELEEAFVRVGLEVEEAAAIPATTGPLVLGRVAEITELTEFRKPIRHTLVDVGEDAPRSIVCGATNFAVGDLVAVALPGAVLPGGFEIASRKTYGHISDGMICSAAELGLGADHSGILVLEDALGAPGDPAAPVLGLDDTVFELSVTPDRGYCLSLRGLGREIACGADLPFADPAEITASAVAGPSRGVDLRPDSGAVRFVLREVRGIDPQARTPWWLRRRLLLAGIRPISPAVDVTNYVMLELGQPLHAFDAARVEGDLVVRRAAAGETLTTLDDTERTLDAEDVVICDDTGPISLAGVMGGATTEVSDETVDVLLEGACWDPLAVFRTVRRHKLPSEAARRYERHVDPAVAGAAVERAARLLVEIAGGEVAAVCTDVGAIPQPAPVTMELTLPDRVAGVDYATGAAAHRLTQVGCTVEFGVSDDGAQTLTAVPPTWRPDLTRPADLVEEVLRLEGLDRIPSVLPAATAGRGLSPRQRRRRAVGRALAYDGYVEIQPTPFLPAGVFDTWQLAADDPRRITTRVLNPLEAERPELATTLLPALLETTARNIARGNRDLALFAVAQVVRPATAAPGPAPVPTVAGRADDAVLAAVDAALPAQPVHVATVLTGLRDPRGPWGPGRAADVHDAVAAAGTIGDAAGVAIVPVAAQYAPFHPGRCAALTVDGTVVGHAGELHPAVLERAGLPARTCALELDLDALPYVENLPAPVISAYPPVLQDVALVVAADVPAAAVAAALRTGAGELLEDLELFDVYTGDQVGPGHKSLAYALRFRATDRTLTEDEASAAREGAIAEAGRAVGAELRA